MGCLILSGTQSVPSAENLVGLALNGNQLTCVAPEIGRCASLTTLSLQFNRLQNVPQQLTELQASISSLSNAYFHNQQ